MAECILAANYKKYSLAQHLSKFQYYPHNVLHWCISATMSRSIQQMHAFLVLVVYLPPKQW